MDLIKCSDINIRGPYVLVENGTYYMYGTRAKNFGIETGSFDVYVSNNRLYFTFHTPNITECEHPVFVELNDNGDSIVTK